MSEDINSETDNEPSQIRHQTPSNTDVVDDALTAEAKEALAALDANGKDHIGSMLRLGEVLSKARRDLKHGRFAKWCGDDLKRSPSWCSAHRRLFEGREDLQPGAGVGGGDGPSLGELSLGGKAPQDRRRLEKGSARR